MDLYYIILITIGSTATVAAGVGIAKIIWLERGRRRDQRRAEARLAEDREEMAARLEGLRPTLMPAQEWAEMMRQANGATSSPSTTGRPSEPTK